MKLLQTIGRAYQSGNLQEKAFQAWLTRSRTVRNQMYRFLSQGVRELSSGTARRIFPSKESAQQQLKNLLGDLSGVAGSLSTHEKDRIVALAHKSLERRFTMLGANDVRLGPIDWHRDFKSGFVWPPGRFYLDYQQVDTSNMADVKVPRELSRSHHLLVLGEAYLLTRDERYAKELMVQVDHWISQNPLMYSINWGCTMDVAIRAVNWIWATGCIIDSPPVTESFLTRLFASLYQHGFFIYRNPEREAHNNNNHYIADLVGQIYLGCLFHETREGRVWLARGTSELFKEIRIQILPGGADYERSTNYHRLVLEMVSSALILLRRCRVEIPADVWSRLESMFEFTLHYTKPDGTAPVIGDQDDGWLHPFGTPTNLDHRFLLSLGAVLFGREDFKRHSDSYNAYCVFLLGPAGKSVYDGLPPDERTAESRAFKDAGFFVMRKAESRYLIVNLSGKSLYPELGGATHTHSDLLSIEVYAGDKTFLVDPGSFVYSADPRARKLFRSTAMHNTVVVDGQDQNVLHEDELWDFERNAIPKLNTWTSHQTYDLFDGEHSGYQRLKEPVTHRRVIRFDKRDGNWEITDYLTGTGTHEFDWFFHFDVGIPLVAKGQCLVTQCPRGTNMSLSFSAPGVFDVSIQPGWVSKSYGTRQAATVGRLKAKAPCPFTLTTMLRILEPRP